MYRYQFTSPGTYNYWSGNVDSRGKVVMRGIVKVQEWASFTKNVTVKVAGHEAIYNTSSGL